MLRDNIRQPSSTFYSPQESRQHEWNLAWQKKMMTIQCTAASSSTEGRGAWRRSYARTSRGPSEADVQRTSSSGSTWWRTPTQTAGRFVTGPPGTGKSFVVDKCVRKCLKDGGRVLYALPTAQQASRARAKHPEADVDTCSGAFLFYKNAIEVMDCLQQYDLVAVDEISQLSQKDFERIVQMWEAADKVPALVFAGGFWQLPGVNPSRATDSPRWNLVHKFELHEMFRCKDEVLKQKLKVLRTSTPTKQQLNTISRGHKAWSGHKEPTAWALQQLYRNRPTTTIATCTRRAAALVNNLSIWALFTTRKKRELASLPVDWEANAENYDQDGRGGWVAVRRLCQVVIIIPKGTKDSINNAPRKYSPVRVKLPFAHQQNVCRPPRFRERRQVPAMFAKVIVSCRQIQWDKCRICSFPLDATWSLGIAPRVLKPRHATGEPQQAHHWPAASGVGHEALQRHAAAHHPQRQQRGGLHQRHGVRRRELRAQVQVCARQDKDEQALAWRFGLVTIYLPDMANIGMFTMLHLHVF